MALRHSHIAVRKTIWPLARTAGAHVSIGEDDLGRYRYFDLIVSHDDGNHQKIRFASHFKDGMVHVLSERIDLVSDLAAALFAAGVKDGTALSISTDRDGHPVRSVAAITERLAAMSGPPEPAYEPPKRTAAQSGRHLSLPMVAVL